MTSNFQFYIFIISINCNLQAVKADLATQGALEIAMSVVAYMCVCPFVDNDLHHNVVKLAVSPELHGGTGTLYFASNSLVHSIDKEHASNCPLMLVGSLWLQAQEHNG